MSFVASLIGKTLSTGFRATSFAARKAVLPLAWGAAKQVPGIASTTAVAAFKMGGFAFRHPYLTLGAIGTGAYLATNTSPYDSPTIEGDLEGIRLNSRFNEEQMAAEALNESGIAPMGGIVSGAAIRNQKLMESTVGLNFGLHRSRH